MLHIRNDLRYWRCRRGVSQKDLAAQVRLKQPDISELETGRVLPSEDELDAICQILGVEPADLYSRDVLGVIAAYSRRRDLKEARLI